MLLCSTVWFPKASTLQGTGGHSCNKNLSCAAVSSLSLGAQTNRSHCSVLCANVQTDPRLPFKKRSKSLLMGRHCSYSLCNSPGQRPRVCVWNSRHFLGLKTCPALKYLLWINHSSELSSLGISLQLCANEDALLGCKVVVTATSSFNRFFTSFH